MSKNNTPAVSVVMPAFNAEKHIKTAIQSILSQTFANLELIIIDDGSNDSTGDIIAKFAQKDKRIIVLRNKINIGICKSLNKGIKQARGKYLARMDSDDWSFPDRLYKQFAFMKKHPKAVVCGGAIEVCDGSLKVMNQRRYPVSDKKIREKMLRINPFAHPAVIFKKDAVLKVGGYNEKLFTVEDYDLYFRLGKIGKFANLSSKVLKLRTHKNSVSSKLIAKQARLNLYVRLKAVYEYGYIMNLSDKIYFFLNFLGVICIPSFLKFKTYNFLRRFY